MSARLVTQEELAEAHGTPEEFAMAVWRACNDLMITTDEAWQAIRDYNHEFEQARP